LSLARSLGWTREEQSQCTSSMTISRPSLKTIPDPRTNSRCSIVSGSPERSAWTLAKFDFLVLSAGYPSTTEITW
jgi:hypothetical protein